MVPSAMATATVPGVNPVAPPSTPVVLPDGPLMESGWALAVAQMSRRP
jgi:hypothetical protein